MTQGPQSSAPVVGAQPPPEPRQQSFARRGLVIMIIRLYGVAVTFGVTILLSRGLGAAGFGLYSQLIAVAMLATLPTQFGLPELVVRETARSVSKGRSANLSSLWHWASLFILSNSAVVIVVLWIASQWLGGFFATASATAIVLTLTIIPIIAFSSLRASILRGLGHDLFGQFPEHAVRPTAFILGLFLFIALSPAEMTVSSTLFLQVAAYCTSMAVGMFLLYRLLPAQQPRALKSKQRKLWRNSTFLMGSISGLLLINNSFDILMLGIWKSDADVGIYRLASMVAALISIGHQTMNMYAMPHLSRLLVSDDKSALGHLVRRISQISTGFSLTVFAFVVLFGDAALVLFFGTEFTGAMPILIVLAVGHFINALFGPAYTLLVMARKESLAARITVLGTVGNILLNLVLIPPLGGIGAAIATTVSVAVTKLISFYFVHKLYGVQCWPFPGLKGTAA